MSAPGQEPQPPQAVGPTEPPDITTVLQVIDAQLEAAEVLAQLAQGQKSAAEAKDFAQASLLLSQAAIVLDPALSQGGTPIAHDVALQQIRNEGAVAVERQRGDNAVRQAKAAPAAPTPVKSKTVSVKRDANGRASEYSVNG